MLGGPVLETERLILRPPEAGDLDAWAEFAADEEASKFLGGPQERNGAWRSMSSMAGSWVLHGFGPFSVIEKNSGLWVGRLGPFRPDGWPGPEILWGVARSAWGKGYAPEGAAAAIDWAFSKLGWDEVIHCIDPANKASISVAEKLGSRHAREVRLPKPFDAFPVQAWGQTKEDWHARKRA